MPSTRSWCAAIRTCSARNRRLRPTRSCPSGDASRTPSPRPSGRRPPDCWAACRARCRPWWKRSRSLRKAAGRGLRLGKPRAGAGQTPRGIGRVRPGAPQRRAGRTGGRARRHAVRPGQPGALRQSGSRAGAAPHQREIPHPLEPHRSPPGRAGPQTGRRHHRRNGGACGRKRSASSADRNSPVVPTGGIRRRSSRCRRPSGAMPTANSSRCVFWRWWRKVGGHVFGALRRRPHDRLLFRHPRHQAGRAPLPAQPHAGRAAGVSQRADRPPPQTPPARGCPGARHRPDRVDLRSAGTEERFPEYRKAGRHRAASTRKISTAPPPAPCTAVCPRTAALPNGGSIRRGCTRILERDGARGQARRPVLRGSPIRSISR